MGHLPGPSCGFQTPTRWHPWFRWEPHHVHSRGGVIGRPRCPPHPAPPPAGPALSANATSWTFRRKPRGVEPLPQTSSPRARSSGTNPKLTIRTDGAEHTAKATAGVACHVANTVSHLSIATQTTSPLCVWHGAHWKLHKFLFVGNSSHLEVQCWATSLLVCTNGRKTPCHGHDPTPAIGQPTRREWLRIAMLGPSHEGLPRLAPCTAPRHCMAT